MEEINKITVENTPAEPKKCIGRPKGRNEDALYMKDIKQYRKEARDHFIANNPDTKRFIACPCGGKYNYFNKNSHIHSKKHIMYFLEDIQRGATFVDGFPVQN